RRSPTAKGRVRTRRALRQRSSSSWSCAEPCTAIGSHHGVEQFVATIGRIEMRQLTDLSRNALNQAGEPSQISLTDPSPLDRRNTRGVARAIELDFILESHIEPLVLVMSIDQFSRMITGIEILRSKNRPSLLATTRPFAQPPSLRGKVHPPVRGWNITWD